MKKWVFIIFCYVLHNAYYEISHLSNTFTVDHDQYLLNVEILKMGRSTVDYAQLFHLGRQLFLRSHLVSYTEHYLLCKDQSLKHTNTKIFMWKVCFVSDSNKNRNATIITGSSKNEISRKSPVSVSDKARNSESREECILIKLVLWPYYCVLAHFEFFG